jgi:hypothetical protein
MNKLDERCGEKSDVGHQAVWRALRLFAPLRDPDNFSQRRKGNAKAAKGTEDFPFI